MRPPVLGSAADRKDRFFEPDFDWNARGHGEATEAQIFDGHQSAELGTGIRGYGGTKYHSPVTTAAQLASVGR